MSLYLVLVIAGVVVLIWIGFRYATPEAFPISTDDPLWVEAVARARSTMSEMMTYHDEGRDVWVKFPVDTARAPEHVWGRVASRSGDVLECHIETPTVVRSGTPASDTVQVRASDIEDWQVELEDGTIRGGFTTTAQAEIAKRQGRPVPSHVREMLGRIRN